MKAVLTRAGPIEQEEAVRRPLHHMSIPDRLDRLPFGPFHWLLVLVMFVATAFDNMDQIILSFAIPAFRREWGLSPITASLLPTLGLTGTFFGAAFWGWIADRIGRKPAFVGTVGTFSGC